jgi:hypothetical protein
VRLSAACLVEATSIDDLNSESNTMCNTKNEIMSFRNDFTGVEGRASCCVEVDTYFIVE